MDKEKVYSAMIQGRCNACGSYAKHEPRFRGESTLKEVMEMIGDINLICPYGPCRKSVNLGDGGSLPELFIWTFKEVH